MNPLELNHCLDKKFKVLEFIDLAELIADPTVGYRTLKQGHKTCFNSNERFVFYTNSHVGHKTISYLQHAADMFDVSRCFILVCCPSHDPVNNKYDIEFFNTQVNALWFDDAQMISIDSLCALPWFHLEVMNQGHVKACCFSKENLNKSNNISLKDSFNSTKMQNLRQSLLKGERPSNCNTCWERESKGLESLRQWRNKSHKEEFFTKLLNNPQLKSLVLRPSTVCNFKCRVCGPKCSSLWAHEQLTYATNTTEKKKLLEVIDDSKWFDNDLESLDDVLKLIPELEFIDLYGGEPLLLKNLKLIIEESIKCGVAHKQRLHFNTNASIFPINLIPIMSNFKEVTISLSIDDIGQRFEVARGGVWQEIENNIDRFLECNPLIFKVSALVTVSNLNLLYLDELIEWADKKKLDLTFNMLHYPEYFRFDKITKETKEIVLQKYKNYPNQFVQTIVADIKQIDPVDCTLWVDQMKMLDNRRNQNLLVSHQMLAESMGYQNEP